MTITLQDPWNSESVELICGPGTMLVVDPYLVNMPDLIGATEGTIVRLKRPAWGKHLLNEAVKVVPIPQNGANYCNDLC